MPAVHTEPRLAPAENRPPAEVALAELYERHSSRIFGFCRRRLRTPQEAEDAVQNTFISAMQALQRGTVPVCETAWLFKIAENACNGIYRAGARRDDRELTDPESLARFPGPDSGGYALVGLEAALSSIPENQRRAFVLRELRGLSYAEIAGQLGVSVASVETLIYRARRGLARALESGAGLRGRLAGALNLGPIVGAAKAWFTGVSAVKVAVATAVIATAAVPARDVLAHDSRGPTPAPAPSIAEEPADDSHRPGVTVSRSALWSAKSHVRQALPERRLTLDRRPAPSRGGEVADRAPTRPSSPDQREPSPEPSAPRPGPPAQASSPPAPAPATPVELPPVAEPVPLALQLPEAPPLPKTPPLPEAPRLPEAPPLPQAPQLPDLPAVPDAGATVPGLPHLP